MAGVKKKIGGIGHLEGTGVVDSGSGGSVFAGYNYTVLDTVLSVETEDINDLQGAASLGGSTKIGVKAGALVGIKVRGALKLLNWTCRVLVPPQVLV